MIGIIDAGGVAPVIEGPESVRAGQPAAFIVNTFGSSSCVQPESVSVRRDGSTFVLTPFDRLPAPTAICTMDYASRPHPVTLTFPAAGQATIRVRGMVNRSGATELDSISRPITVLP